MSSPFVRPASHFCRALVLIALAATLASAPRQAAAEDWPTRPITIVLSFGGGGMMDFATRTIAHELTTTLGQPVVVETKPGGGGVVGAISVAKAPPDGYTLLVSAVGPMVFRPLMHKLIGFDTDKDFTPIILVGDTPNVMLANPKLGLNTVKDLMAYADKKQHRLTIGHPGVGTMGHLCGVLFAAKAHIDGTFVAYRGASAIITDLMGGQIDIGTPSYGPGSDVVKILAVTGEERLESLPDVPTLKESGVDLFCSTWLAIYAPAGVPRPIVDKLNGAINAFLRKPETRGLLGKAGMLVRGGPPEVLHNRTIADRATWAPILTAMTLDPAK
jgi:tripartite-type tricarboxylate transporter receptor subunit TctC